MAKEQSIGGKDMLRFLMYMGIIAICIAALLYMLLNAHPREAPKVKNTGSKSQLSYPALRPDTASSAAGDGSPILVSASRPLRG